MPLVDEQDLSILQAMRVYPFNGKPHGPDALRPAAVALKTGLAIDFVKTRIARMENNGIITGYQIYPSPRQLGAFEQIVHLRVPDEARDVFHRKVEQHEGVVGISRFVGGSVCVDVTGASLAVLSNIIASLSQLAGQTPEAANPYIQPGPPAQDIAWSHLDWRILQCLRGNAKRPWKDVAQQLGVTSKTVRRRIQRMSSAHSIDAVVEPNFGKISGAILFAARVTCVPQGHDAVIASARAALGARTFSVLRPADAGNAIMVDGFAFEPAEVDEMRRRIGAIPGVQEVELLYPASVTASSQWLDDAINAKAARPRADPTAETYEPVKHMSALGHGGHQEAT